MAVSLAQTLETAKAAASWMRSEGVDSLVLQSGDDRAEIRLGPVFAVAPDTEPSAPPAPEPPDELQLVSDEWDRRRWAPPNGHDEEPDDAA